MSIPRQTDMFKLVLEIAAASGKFTRREMKSIVVDRLGLSEQEKELLTSSNVPVYESRVGWAVSWLNAAGYVNRIDKGVYEISDLGAEVLKMNLSASELSKYIHEGMDNASNSSDEEPEVSSSINSDLSPMEQIDYCLEEINAQLSKQLMDSIMEIKGREGDIFFEKLVTDLLVHMGYGEGKVTAAVSDEGIDGIIKTDPLGFNPILIQAKRYSIDNPVGRPEIQKFAGALGAVTRGAFITTSLFTTGAIQFAKAYPHADIVLIDGKKLTELMIAYNLGVSVEKEISIKKLDSDYFEN